MLPKKRGDENQLEWITKDGMTFLAPIQDCKVKVNNIRKLEQAFRVYAAIYCNANPNRAGEIWQYIYTINSAATSYQWENVAHYDVVFRQMMSDRPGSSWAKLYTQLWQLALKDLLQRNAGNAGNPGSSSTQGGGLSHGRIGVAGILTAQVPVTGQVVSLPTGVRTVVPGTMGLTIVARRTRVVVTKQPAAVA